MEQQIIALVNQHFANCFIEVKNILLHPDSYHEAVETEHFFDYFRFLERALQKPYNRLISLTNFVKNDEGLLSTEMYPLVLLREEAKTAIEEKCNQVFNFAHGLDIGKIDPEMKSLSQENH